MIAADANVAMLEIVSAAERDGLFSPRATAACGISYGISSTRAWVRGACPRLGRQVLLEVRSCAVLSLRPKRRWRSDDDPVGVVRYRAAALVPGTQHVSERARYGETYTDTLFAGDLRRTRLAGSRLTDLMVDAFREAVDWFRDYHQQLEMTR